MQDFCFNSCLTFVLAVELLLMSDDNFFLRVTQRALEPPDVHHERLLPVSIAGLLVNLVGIFVFQHGGHGHSHGGEGTSLFV